MSKWFIWVDTDGKPVSAAHRYRDETDLAASVEERPSGAVFIRTGSKEQLMHWYRLTDKDFVADE